MVIQSNNDTGIRDTPYSLASSSSIGKTNFQYSRRKKIGKTFDSAIVIVETETNMEPLISLVLERPQWTEHPYWPTFNIQHEWGTNLSCWYLGVVCYCSITSFILTNTRWLELITLTNIRWLVILDRFQNNEVKMLKKKRNFPQTIFKTWNLKNFFLNWIIY